MAQLGSRSGAGEPAGRRISYLAEALKAVGRIIAALALLRFRTVFWALRLCMAAECVLAVYALAFDFEITRLAGAALAAIGAVFVVWTHELVKKHPVSEGRLVTNGPFAVVRHPMYSGWALAAIGAAMVSRSWPAFVLAALQVIVMLSVSCAEDEENAEVFGGDYLAYSREVWLTGIITGCVRSLFRKK